MSLFETDRQMDEIGKWNEDCANVPSPRKQFYAHPNNDYGFSNCETGSSYSASPIEAEKPSCSLWTRNKSFSQTLDLSNESLSSEEIESLCYTGLSESFLEEVDGNYASKRRVIMHPINIAPVRSVSPMVQRCGTFQSQKGSVARQTNVPWKPVCGLAEVIKNRVQQSSSICSSGSNYEKVHLTRQRGEDRVNQANTIAANWNCMPKLLPFRRSRTKEKYQKAGKFPVGFNPSMGTRDSQEVTSNNEDLVELRATLRAVQCKLDRLDKEQAIAFAAVLRPRPIYFAS